VEYGKQTLLNMVDAHLEAQAFNWFDVHYATALLPDYALEHPENVPAGSIVVLACHIEYASEAMLYGLQALLAKGCSLLSLGGNQLYWRAEWNADHTWLECRKDVSWFAGGRGFGGMWKHHLRSEDKLMGVRFSAEGMHTYAPYEALNGHRLLLKAGIQAGEVFGTQSINGLPLSGDETDKTDWFTPQGTEILATAANGGTIAYHRLGPKQSILSTGSIQSASGLGVDSPFTRLIAAWVAEH
jgi:hypothetical protein